jgi:hypothetical protein
METATISGRGYSVGLLGVGLLHLLLAFAQATGPAVVEGEALRRFISSILFLVAAACVTAALLRWTRVPAALPVTAALSLCLLFVFPFGTALSIYWLTRVREREISCSSAAERARFLYTVALYVLALLLVDAALVFRFVLHPGPDDDILRAFFPGFLVMASLFLAVALLRSGRSYSRLAYGATFGLNVLVVLWFPLGTALALVWFLSVRKHEKSLAGLVPAAGIA